MCEHYPVLHKHFSFDHNGARLLPVSNLFFSYEYVNVRCMATSNVEVSCTYSKDKDVILYIGM
jgi:hypothetical protein